MIEKALQPIEQRQVDFYGDELTAVRANDNQVYVSIRHMCNALGIRRPQRQTDRIKRDEVLSDGLQRVPIMGTRGRQQNYVLRVDLVPLWLTGIETSRVSDKVKSKIVQYKREAAKVLWEAFQEGRLTADPIFDDLMAQDTPEARAVRMAEAVLQLARNQLLVRAQVEDNTRRLEAIEAQLGDPGRHVTQDEASQISQAVKAVAMTLSKASGSNQYGSVYGELYRKYGITSYKQLPSHRFDEALEFLTEWYNSLTSKEPF